MARSNWSGENPNDNYTRRVELDRRRQEALRQERAARAAGRGKRSI